MEEKGKVEILARREQKEERKSLNPRRGKKEKESKPYLQKEEKIGV